MQHGRIHPLPPLNLVHLKNTLNKIGLNYGGDTTKDFYFGGGDGVWGSLSSLYSRKQ